MQNKVRTNSKVAQAPSTANARTPKTRQARFGEPRRGPPPSRREAKVSFPFRTGEHSSPLHGLALFGKPPPLFANTP